MMREYTDEEWEEMIAQLAGSGPDLGPAPVVTPEPAPAPVRPAVVPQASDPERPPILQQRAAPEPAPAPPVASLDTIERQRVKPTFMDNLGMTAGLISTGLEGAANRLGNRPTAPSGAGQALVRSIQGDLGRRQDQANLEYRERVANMFKQQAAQRAQQEAAQKAGLTDPNSAASERAWRAVNAMRTAPEVGLPPLDPSLRSSFVAADAKQWLTTRPAAASANFSQRQAEEAAKRKQEQGEYSAQQQLAVLRELNVPIGNIDTSDPAAVKLAFDTAMKREGWSEAEKRSRIEAAAQRQQQQQVHEPTRRAIADIKDSDYYASHPEEAYQAANNLQMMMADPTFHQSGDSERVVKGMSPVIEMLKGRSRTVEGWKQIEGRPPPSESEWKEAMALSDGAEKIRKGMEYLEQKAPEGLMEWLEAQGGTAAQVIAGLSGDDALQQFPALRQWVKSSQDLEDFKSAASGIALALKDFESMGALDKGTQDISKEISGNPTGLLTMITGNSGRAVREALDRTLAAVPGAMKNRGFEPPGGRRGGDGGGQPKPAADDSSQGPAAMTPKQQRAQQLLDKFGNSPEMTPEKRAKLEAIVRGGE